MMRLLGWEHRRLQTPMLQKKQLLFSIRRRSAIEAPCARSLHFYTMIWARDLQTPKSHTFPAKENTKTRWRWLAEMIMIGKLCRDFLGNIRPRTRRNPGVQ